jgi:hypothetical protein
MEIPKKFKCDLGGEVYDKAEAVQYDVQVVNGINTRHYNQVCEFHCGQLVKLIDSAFKRNKEIEKSENGVYLPQKEAQEATTK